MQLVYSLQSVEYTWLVSLSKIAETAYLLNIHIQETLWRRQNGFPVIVINGILETKYHYTYFSKNLAFEYFVKCRNLLMQEKYKDNLVIYLFCCYYVLLLLLLCWVYFSIWNSDSSTMVLPNVNVERLNSGSKSGLLIFVIFSNYFLQNEFHCYDRDLSNNIDYIN